MQIARIALLSGIVASLALAADSSAPKQRRTHVRLAGVSVSAGYASGPVFYPWAFGPFGYGWWPAAYYWDPWYMPYLPGYSGFARGPGMGEVKLETEAKDAQVYINGAYAGIAGDLKHMWLDPGAYNLEVKSGDLSFSKRIYVLSGKTMKIDAVPQPAEARP
jgi:hypothetical protein